MRPLLCKEGGEGGGGEGGGEGGGGEGGGGGDGGEDGGHGAQVRSFFSPPSWQAVTSHPDPQSVQGEHSPSFGCAPLRSHS
jgi:hypothetical protein